jgi:arginase
MRRPVAVLDAASDLGLRPTGVRDAPAALRGAGLLEGLANASYAGCVDAPPYAQAPQEPSGVLNADSLRSYSVRLADAIGHVLDRDAFPLVLGGDCSILLGSALALRRRGRYGLFFIDGHADFYSPRSEPNGELASMDLAVVTGREPLDLADLEGRRPLIQERDVVLFGYRDAESAAEFGSPDVRTTAIHNFDLPVVRSLGAAAAASAGLAALDRDGIDGIWIHLDADVLNDDVMPAVDYRMPDGLWPHELGEALAVVLASAPVIGMQVTIYNPSLDSADRFAARTLVTAIIGAFTTALDAHDVDHADRV